MIEATHENAQRLLDALLESKLGTASMISPNELLTHEITVFKDFIRIDVQTSTPGMDFKISWDKREIMKHQGQEFNVA